MAEYIEREAVKAKAMTGWVYLGFEDDVVTIDDILSEPGRKMNLLCRSWGLQKRSFPRERGTPEREEFYDHD